MFYWPLYMIFNLKIVKYAHESVINFKGLIKFYREYYSPIYGKLGFNIGTMLSVPLSRGSLTLRSKNPFDAPLIDPNFLSHPQDVRILIAGNRIGHRQVFIVQCIILLKMKLIIILSRKSK